MSVCHEIKKNHSLKKNHLFSRGRKIKLLAVLLKDDRDKFTEWNNKVCLVITDDLWSFSMIGIF